MMYAGDSQFSVDLGYQGKITQYIHKISLQCGYATAPSSQSTPYTDFNPKNTVPIPDGRQIAGPVMYDSLPADHYYL